MSNRNCVKVCDTYTISGRDQFHKSLIKLVQRSRLLNFTLIFLQLNHVCSSTDMIKILCFLGFHLPDGCFYSFVFAMVWFGSFWGFLRYYLLPLICAWPD
jgi:hypothetical protein